MPALGVPAWTTSSVPVPRFVRMPFFPYLSLSCDLGAEASPLGMVSVTRGGLAQLARAPALQAGGQRFESVILHPMAQHLADVDEVDDVFVIYHLSFVI